MEEHMDFILAKVFPKVEYATGFLDGIIHINQLTTFGIDNLYTKREDMNNKYRGDLNEGLVSNVPLDDIASSNSLYNFIKNISEIPYDSTVVGELDSRLLSKHVLCLLALYYDANNNAFVSPDKQMLNFDNAQAGATVIIYDVNEFLYRLVSTLCAILGSDFWIAYGLVDYCLSLDSRHESYEFNKTKEYEWQQEFRIAIDVGSPDFKVNSDKLSYDIKSGALSVNIGDISKIAFMITTKKFVDLDFPEKYDWILHTSPNKVCPFYPPVKNVISYVCPVIRSKNDLYYGTQALYPIIRDIKSYSINRIFVTKSANMIVTTDFHFLRLANIYFERLLDICKSQNDTEKLSSLLTAIVTYMIILQIRDLAGIHLVMNGENIQPSYHNLHVEDLSLLDIDNSYLTIHRNSVNPTNTDFAELVSMSDDTEFPEYEYEGKKYCRIVVNRDDILSSGLKVIKGEAVWVEVSKVKWFMLPNN